MFKDTLLMICLGIYNLPYGSRFVLADLTGVHRVSPRLRMTCVNKSRVNIIVIANAGASRPRKTCACLLKSILYTLDT